MPLNWTLRIYPTRTWLGQLVLLLVTSCLLLGCSSAFSQTSVSEAEFTEDEIEPTTLEAVTTGRVEVGMPYGEARQHLMDQGWIPHTIRTGGPAPKAEPWLGEKQMYELGFDEVVSCSGTGQGYCRFEFVFKDRTAEDGPILAITTYASSDRSDPKYPEPFFSDLRVEHDHINKDYRQRSLSAEIFQEIQRGEAFQQKLRLQEGVQYAFADAVLLARSYEYGENMALFPRQPLSKEEALNYAKILDPEKVMDFENYSTDIESDLELYFPRGYVRGNGPTRTISLQYTMTGQVSKISHVLPMF